MSYEFGRPTPTLRIFDEAKAREFYLDFLGFEVEFEHRFGDDFPLFMGIKQGECRLHLSEHHGDACPGAAMMIEVKGVRDYQQALAAKTYKYSRPGEPEETEWGTRELGIRDPFGNKLTFFENVPKT
jgi:uncharacterized glyoxalase superfamily protein PhnB